MTMALVDPYSPCPCGSDKKYKWCCQKAESFVERAQRLVESNQLEAAVGILNEGLAKHPDSPWLKLRKSLLLAALHRHEEAKECCTSVLRDQPDHIGAAILRLRVVLSSDSPDAAALELQHALKRIKPEQRHRLVRMIGLVADQLARVERIPAALKHYALAVGNESSGESPFATALRELKAEPGISPWLKEPYTLSPPPANLGEAQREPFDRALEWAREGLFESAASAFELLTADRVAGVAAERNLGLCRLWLGDEPGAAEALWRWIGRAGSAPEAVDLAVVCQLIRPIEDPEPIEQVQLTWPLRDREALLKTLGGLDSVVNGGSRSSDPENEDSPEIVCYHWLDRPNIESRAGLSREQIPLIQADILVGQDTVALETQDDGRLNGLIDRFTSMAGKSVPPAHPRTKVLHRIDRSDQALICYWHLPPGLPADEVKRLESEQTAYIVKEIWPETPLEMLGGRSPVQVSRAGQHGMALQAEVLRLESSSAEWGEMVPWNELRGRLGIPVDPPIDLATLDVDRVPVGRLFRLPLSALDDDRLIKLYYRAREFGLNGLILKTAHEIVSRPEAGRQGKIDPVGLFGILAMEAAGGRDFEGSMGWLRRGRTSAEPRLRGELAPHWDMLEIQVRAMHEEPEEWVPELAVVLERYASNEPASMVLTTRMLEMGLVRLGSPPDRPGELILDSRPLQQLLSRYGPKVTTASGYLGVSATKGEIWTPDSESKGSSSIWTPGSDAASPGGKPRIIMTGQ
jgi:tetratricopeptide (TPR) repeat protein